MGPSLGTSRGAGSPFPGTGTPRTARALSSGWRRPREVDASAPPSPWVRALHSRGRNVPRVRLLVLSSSSTVESLTPYSQWHSDLIVCLDVQISGPPARPGGRPPRQPARACISSLALALSLSLGPPGLPEAPALPFRTRKPPNLSWTLLGRALLPASPCPRRSCNLEAQLPTSDDFSWLSSPRAKFPERSRGLWAFGPRRPHTRRELRGGGEGKWVCARRRVSGSNSTWLPSARASPAPAASRHSFFF